ncbi:MAG: MG2 domain-containing protein [Myxococcota bacterium]
MAYRENEGMIGHRHFRTVSGPWAGALALTALLAGLACGSDDDAYDPSHPDGHVVSYSPEGSSWDSQPELRVVFDQPVVEEDLVGQRDERTLATLEPEAELTPVWQDRQTLVLHPETPLTLGHRYTLRLGAELPLNLPREEREHTFVVHPLEVNGIADADIDWFPPEGTFSLRFNLPVQSQAVVEHCFIEADGTKIQLSAAEEVTADRVGVRPASVLEKDTNYKIRCEGLTADGGNAPIEDYEASVRTYPELAVHRVTPDGSGQATPDDLELTIELNTPVSLEAFREHVQIRPAVEGFANRWVPRGRTTFTQTINLEASTDYRLTVREGLTDEFGQSLANNHQVSFETTDASPRLYMETGIYAVEAEGRGYPVWSRNVGRFQVECAFVPKAKIAELLTTTMDYDPWYSDGEGPTIPWAERGLRPTSFAVESPSNRNRWQLHDLDLPNRCGGAGRRGLYLVELTSREVAEGQEGDYFRYPYRVLGNVTNLGVLLKAGPSSGLVWVTQLSDGQPVANAAISVYAPNGRRVHAGRTDDQGIARLPGSSRLLEQRGPGDAQDFEEDYGYGYYDSYRSQRMIVVVEKDNDLAAVDGNWQNGIQIWNFGVPQDTRTGGESVTRGFILSDRGIYRPGETVHFKGLVREVSAGAPPSVPRARNLVLHIEDSEGNELSRRRLELNEFGAFDFNHRLSREAPLGDYLVRATVGRETFRERFVVQEFRPASFEITQGEGDAPVLRERVSLPFNASYLFGAPLANADAEWSVYRRPKFLRFPDYPSYSFEDWSSLDTDRFWSRYETSESYITDGVARTDARGNLRVAFQDRAESFRGPQDYLVNVSVTDPTDQTISKRSVITMHPTDLYLGLHTQEYVQAVNMPFSVNAVALTPEGQRLSKPATLSYLRRTRDCTRSEGPYAWSSCENVLTPVWSREIQLSEGGALTERITPEEPGEFIIKLEGTDREGRPVAASSMVWILGEGEAFWSGDESARMSLIASKESYDIGDTARLIPQADVAGATVLITTERSGVLDARVETLGTGVQAVEVPIEDGHAPNVFVSVAAVRGRTSERDSGRPTFALGLANLEVSTRGKALEIAIETDKQDYRPGETVTGSLRVTHLGNPVEAEIALSVADEGVLSLIGYQTPNPISSFYRSWSLGVENATNWNRIARSRPPLGWEEEDGSDVAGGDGDRVRSRFVSSAYWNPSLRTDAEGRVSFTFEAPDNLTAFRLMATAADTGDRFGSADQRIRVRKELMIAPLLPRFFNQGDRIQAGVVVHNYTRSAGTAEVTLVDPEGLWVREHTQEVEVPARGSRRVMYWGRASEHRSRAKLQFRATMGAYEDAFEEELPIRRPRVFDRELLASGELTEAGTIEAALAWEDPTIPRDSELQVTVDRTGLADLSPSLEYLVGYPYGCLEQTLSKLIPMFAARDLARSLRLDSIRGNRMRTFIETGVSKVVRHQHGNGLFSFWPSTDRDVQVSAYAMYGLVLAKENNVRVRQDVLDKGAEALRSWANESGRNLTDPSELGTMAMTAYILAALDADDAGLRARLFEARSAMPVYGQAFLGRALVESGAPSEQVTTLATELAARAQAAGDGKIIPERDGISSWYSGDTKATALTLSFLVESSREPELARELLAGLRATRGSSGRWTTTYQNAWALSAFADYARTRTAGPLNVELTVDGRALRRRTIPGGQVFHLSRRLSRVPEGTLALRTDGPAFYSVRLVRARPPTEADAVSEGFEVVREFIDYESGTPIERARVGELIKVKVTVRAQQSTEHVAVVAPIPSGTEIVNTSLETEAGVRGGTSYRHGRFGHVDLRDDQAEAFATRLGQETATFEFLVRATRRGTFEVPSATVEAMYDPTRYARSNRSSFTVVR